MVGPKGEKEGMVPTTTQWLNGSNQTCNTLVDNEARSLEASQGRSQLGLHISIAPIAIVTTEKQKI